MEKTMFNIHRNLVNASFPKLKTFEERKISKGSCGVITGGISKFCIKLTCNQFL